MDSQAARAATLYSASVVDKETEFCFLLHPEILVPPLRNTYPEVDLRSSKSLPK